MGAAAVISLAEVREKRQRAEYRRQLHEQFDLWLDTLEEQMKEPKPTLEQITRAVWAQRQGLTGGLVEGLGVLDVAPAREEIAAKIAQIAAGRRWRPVVVLAVDGADVPTRPETAKGRRPGRKRQRAKRAHWQGQWREAKGFRFYLLDEDRIIHILSWHQIQDHDELFAALKQVKEAGLIPEAHPRLCVVADGAQ